MTEDINDYRKTEKIAVLSDTHGLLRPEVSAIIKECSAVLHAGDVGSREVLEQLEKMAPTYAVRGNVDGEWASFLPVGLEVDLSGKRIYICHRKKDLPADLSGYDLVVYGHSHKYEVTVQEKDQEKTYETDKTDETYETVRGKTLFLNPGSFGPMRFRQPVTMAVLTLEENGEMTVRKVDLSAETGKGKEKAVPQDASVTGSVRDDELLSKDPARLVEQVVAEIKRGRSAGKIARKMKLSEELVESISRMYYTHPGVSTEGILRRLGL